MNCREISDLLSDYIDGCLSDPLCKEIEIHIKVCKVCADKLEATRGVVVALGQLSVQHSPVDCWVGVRKIIVEKQFATPFWQRWFMTPAFAVPVLAVLIMAIFLVWPSPVNERNMSSISSVEYKHFISAHSRLQRLQAFSDHDVTFVAAELENASYTPDAERQ